MHASARPRATRPSARTSAGRRAAAASAAALTGVTALLFATASPGAAATLAAAPGAAHTVPQATAVAKKVPISKDAYTPATLTVRPGEAVEWTNLDAKPHTVTVTSGPEKFDSGLFAQGKSYVHTFDKLGTYEYYCAVHPDMIGTVNVTKNGKAPAKPAGDMDHMGHGDAGAPQGGSLAGLLGPFLPGPAGDAARPGGSISLTSAPTGATEADPLSGALEAFQRHMVAAHYTRTVGGQVEDILDVDSYAKSHEALFRMMLDYEVGKASPAAGAPVAGAFLTHMDAAHWYRSPAQQAADIAEFDDWAKSHEALFRMMLDPAVGKSSAAATGPVTGPFMQHMDAAHWNRSPGEQVSDISVLDRWLNNHAALIQRMLGSADAAPTAAGGGTGH